MALPETLPPPTDEEYRLVAEADLALTDLAAFCELYGRVQHGEGQWAPFELWPAQRPVCQVLQDCREVIVLKARQLGLTWMALHRALQLALAKPGIQIGLFSLREIEAQKLLLARLKGVYLRLPPHMKGRGGRVGDGIDVDAAGEFQLTNGSNFKAFSTNAGDSYTFGFVLVDEADLVPDLGRLLRSVKPTVDAGGQLVLISRANKDLDESNSDFKRIYRAAAAGHNSFRAVFLPWHAAPTRTKEWYGRECRAKLAETGSLDYMYEQYPDTPEQALAPKTLDARLPLAVLERCFQEGTPLRVPGCPQLPGLVVYAAPVPGGRYAVGADPAEGNPTSDDSSLAVTDLYTGEEVASLSGRHQILPFADHLAALCRWYNDAPALVERNNHGHAVLVAVNLMAAERRPRLLKGPDKKEGWHQGELSKALLYSYAADRFAEGTASIRSRATFDQLSRIKGSTLRAPDGQHDDRAVAHVLSLQAGQLAAGLEWVEPEPLPRREASDWTRPRASGGDPFLDQRIPGGPAVERGGRDEYAHYRSLAPE